MSALDGNTFRLGSDFDRACERLFAIANKAGVLLTVRVRKPRKKLTRVGYERKAKKAAKR